MNLKELFKEEINKLQITNKEDIKNYIYIRIGELFDYDAAYLFASEEEQNIISKKRIDITNVTNFNITCTSWAYMFADFMNAFEINNVVVNENKHSYVKTYIDGVYSINDLMSGYRDITNIKFGIKPENIYNLKKDGNVYVKEDINLKLFDKKFEYEKNILKLKKQLFEKRKELPIEKFAYTLFQVISRIISMTKGNSITYLTGRKFISDYIKTFIGNDYKIGRAHFHNKENNDFVEVYSINNKGNKSHYFVFQKNKQNVFEFQEVPEIYIDALYKIYINDYDYSCKPSDTCGLK